jgi:hypothetical protein
LRGLFATTPSGPARRTARQRARGHESTWTASVGKRPQFQPVPFVHVLGVLTPGRSGRRAAEPGFAFCAETKPASPTFNSEIAEGILNLGWDVTIDVALELVSAPPGRLAR